MLTSNSHIRTLDGWRAVAVFFVLLDHGGDPLLKMLDVDAQSARHIKETVGLAGVHLFFALSGYLITSRMLDEERQHGSVNLRQFYLRRLFRIQPAAVFFLLCAGILGLLGVIKVSTVGWSSSLLGVGNLTSAWQTWSTGHFWSLAVEEHFYLLWPAAFIVMRRHRLRGAIVLVLAVALWRFIAVKFQLTMSSNFTVRTDIASEWLLWGCVASLAERHQHGAEIVRAMSSRWASLLVVPLVAAAAAIDANWKVVNMLVSLSALALPALFLGTVQRPESLLGRLLELPAVAWLGKISFSLYLWQQLFFTWDAARSSAMGLLQSFPVNAVLAVVCAAASFYFIERPMIDIGRRFAKRRQGNTTGLAMS